MSRVNYDCECYNCGWKGVQPEGVASSCPKCRTPLSEGITYFTIDTETGNPITHRITEQLDKNYWRQFPTRAEDR